MARVKHCDICRKPTPEIVGKLFYASFHANGGRRQSIHSNYTHHADVGVCCASKILGAFNFQKRVPKEGKKVA